jgi:hypothetical protein
MVVAPLEHTLHKSGSGGCDVIEADKFKMVTEDIRRCPGPSETSGSSERIVNGRQDDNITGASAGQIWNAAGASASQSSFLKADNVHPPVADASIAVGKKRRRESSDSNSSSSSDEATTVAANYRKKRFISHREYKSRKGSPPDLDRRVRCRRRSSSCGSSPDTRWEEELSILFDHCWEFVTLVC